MIFWLCMVQNLGIASQQGLKLNLFVYLWCEGIFDRDMSGTVELHEFQAMFNYITQWRAIFDQYDRDRSGFVDAGELSGSKIATNILKMILLMLK